MPSPFRSILRAAATSAAVSGGAGAITGAHAAGKNHRLEGARKGAVSGAITGGVLGAAVPTLLHGNTAFLSYAVDHPEMFPQEKVHRALTNALNPSKFTSNLDRLAIPMDAVGGAITGYQKGKTVKHDNSLASRVKKRLGLK